VALSGLDHTLVPLLLLYSIEEFGSTLSILLNEFIELSILWLFIFLLNISLLECFICCLRIYTSQLSFFLFFF